MRARADHRRIHIDSHATRELGRLRAALASALVAGALVLSGAVGCDDEAAPRPCTSIPAGGCPLSHGLGCEDPACEAVYACLPGDAWELRQRCPARDGGGAPHDAAAADAEPSLDAAVSLPPGAFGGPGCSSLQPPDCALGVTLACGPDCCGCEDLFVCEDGGWVLWGACADGGASPGR